MNFYFFFKKCCYYYYYLHAIQLFTTNMYQYSLPYSCLFIVLDTGESGVEEWAQWSSCSVTCGQGSQVRTRTCVSPYGTHCSGPLRESRVCNNTALCPGSVSSQYMKLWMLLNLFNAKHLKHHSLTMWLVHRHFDGDKRVQWLIVCESVIVYPCFWSCQWAVGGDLASQRFQEKACHIPFATLILE